MLSELSSNPLPSQGIVREFQNFENNTIFFSNRGIYSLQLVFFQEFMLLKTELRKILSVDVILQSSNFQQLWSGTKNMWNKIAVPAYISW